MRSFLVFIAALALTGCASQPKGQYTDYLMGATLWWQTSGEARALQHQAWNLARLSLERDLKEKKKPGKRAVVIDVDDTVLDNGPYEGRIVKSQEPYPAGWAEWVAKADGKAVTGAVDFLKFAASKGVRIFYLTNRNEKYRKETMANLKLLGFPDLSDETLMCRTEGPGKEERRQKVKKDYRVVLYVGDNLNDFSDIFEKKNIAERSGAVDANREKFLYEWIMIPNPMYGDWESTIYDGNPALPQEEKLKRRNETIKGF